ncbi:MAG: M14 family zinc carboxypeptidase [Bryobacter sp.]|nr:M14 family zinc carboxypeptidase [Bryobacter sp.]
MRWFCFLWLAAAMGAQPLAKNASVWVTPEMQAAKSLAESTARAPKDLLTVAEKTNWQETGTYEECVAFYRELARRSPYARLIDIGASPQGRRMYALVASKDRAFAQAEVKATGKPVILLQNGIHSGENGGKDAAMMLLRDILVTKHWEKLLDQTVILSIPVFSLDAHENTSPYHRVNEQGPARMGFRSTATRLNLNRDYMKADGLEMQNWLKFFHKYQPDFLLDNHVTDGQDMQHDVTIDLNDGPDVDPAVGAWLSQYRADLWKAMEGEGHVMGWYLGAPVRPGGTLNMLPSGPRFSTGYAAVRNRGSLLVETHSLKPFRVRAWAHLNIMRHTLEIFGQRGGGLRSATQAADRKLMQAGQRLPLTFVPEGEGEAYTVKALATESFASEITGANVLRYLPQARDVSVKLNRKAKAQTEAVAPEGYYIPVEWSEVIDRLKLHGVQVHPVAKAVDGKLGLTRFTQVKFAGMPFESRFAPSFAAREEVVAKSLPANRYVFVPVAQPLGKLAMNLLEAQGPDSFLKWGFFNSIFEQKEYGAEYILEPLARDMIAADPKLKEQFEEALKNNPEMAKNPRARLFWFYQRSAYYEQDKDVYPVLRALSK